MEYLTISPPLSLSAYHPPCSPPLPSTKLANMCIYLPGGGTYSRGGDRGRRQHHRSTSGNRLRSPHSQKNKIMFKHNDHDHPRPLLSSLVLMLSLTQADYIPPPHCKVLYPGASALPPVTEARHHEGGMAGGSVGQLGAPEEWASQLVQGAPSPRGSGSACIFIVSILTNYRLRSSE